MRCCSTNRVGVTPKVLRNSRVVWVQADGLRDVVQVDRLAVVQGHEAGHLVDLARRRFAGGRQQAMDSPAPRRAARRRRQPQQARLEFEQHGLFAVRAAVAEIGVPLREPGDVAIGDRIVGLFQQRSAEKPLHERLRQAP